MPSLASGRSCCTAWAMTWAVEWRRTLSPSGESMVTASTLASSGRGWSRSFNSPLTRATTTSRRSKKSSAPVVPVVTLVSSPSTRRVICWASDTGVSYSKLRLRSLWRTGTTASLVHAIGFSRGQPTRHERNGGHADGRSAAQPGDGEVPADPVQGAGQVRLLPAGGAGSRRREREGLRAAEVPGHGGADAD